MTDNKKIILGYWDIRGLATYIRLLLEHAGADWEDKLYTCGPPPEFNRENWLNEKFNLGLDFPNLPYIIDGDIKLTQSGVILRYLARKFNLVPKCPVQLAKAELLQNQLHDYHMEYARMCYGEGFDEAKVNYLANIGDKMKSLTNFIKDKKYAMGTEVTFVDFVLFEYLEGQLFFSPTVLDSFKELKEYHDRIANLDSVKRYFASERAIKEPFNGAPAKFGGKFSHLLSKN